MKTWIWNEMNKNLAQNHTLGWWWTKTKGIITKHVPIPLCNPVGFYPTSNGKGLFHSMSGGMWMEWLMERGHVL
jgi:hypothetical protein